MVPNNTLSDTKAPLATKNGAKKYSICHQNPTTPQEMVPKDALFDPEPPHATRNGAERYPFAHQNPTTPQEMVQKNTLFDTKPHHNKWCRKIPFLTPNRLHTHAPQKIVPKS